MCSASPVLARASCRAALECSLSPDCPPSLPGQTAGVLLAWAGFGIGAWLDGGHQNHLRIGIAVMALATLQVLLGAPPSYLLRSH